MAELLGPLDLKSGNPEFKPYSDHQLDIFQLVLGSAPGLSSLALKKLNGEWSVRYMFTEKLA